ncbi:MAG TPA: carbamate kinase [Acidimicrobiales bacterium]|nr:carbamate kinase [Acidimicrobiales bacterium]
MLIVAALGGNALLQRGETPAAQLQRHHVVDAVAQLARVASGNQLVVTHGNGPQVGLLAVESANDPVLERPFPFDVLGAQTQGMIGYWLLQAFTNALPERAAVALVTQTLVDAHDPAFTHPTKFVGRVYEPDEAQRLARAHGWSVAADGPLWRRVVASPEPRGVLESAIIESLANSGTIVIGVGGGGIPVVRDEHGQVRGAEAVVDKDLASALLAWTIDAELLLLLTDVAGVYEDYDTPAERVIRSASVDELRAGSFAAGSMGPKVEAACRFVESTGRRAAIGSLDDVLGLVEGTSGTSVVASSDR